MYNPCKKLGLMATSGLFRLIRHLMAICQFKLMISSFNTFQRNKKICIIFNYENFLMNKRREGTNVDAASFKSAMEDLDFTVFEFKDCSVAQTTTVLDTMATFHHYQSLRVAVMSHGKLGCFACYDGTFLINELLSKLSNIHCLEKQCFFQTCRGYHRDIEYDRRVRCSQM